jgi:hypothetical protein
VAVFLVNEAVPWCRQYAIFTDKFDQLLKEAQIGTRENTKEVNKEQPSYRNLSATATRVPQCTCPVAASRKDFSAIHTSAQTIHS